MAIQGKLVFYCGKMGAGKSTHSRTRAEQSGAILLSEDEWLAALYPDEIAGLDDYIKYSSRLKPIVKTFVLQLLDTGICVVMDFPANTKRQRAWFSSLLAENDCPHELIYLEADNATCLKRLAKRRIENPERAAFDTDAMFERVTGFFQPPEPEEGFDIDITPVLDN